MKAQARARTAPPTVQRFPPSWPAALKAEGEAEGAPVPEMTASLVGAATRGVEVASGVERAEEDFFGVMLGVMVEVGVWVGVTTAVVLDGVGLGVGVDVGVGVLVEQGPVTVTGIQLRSAEPRVPEGVTVPAEAWQEA